MIRDTTHASIVYCMLEHDIATQIRTCATARTATDNKLKQQQQRTFKQEYQYQVLYSASLKVCCHSHLHADKFQEFDRTLGSENS